MHEDAIQLEECKIIIRSGYNAEGEPVFSTAFEGAPSYIQTLGLLEVAKDAVKDVYYSGGMED